MRDWEINLQRVDKVLYQWMKAKSITSINPPGCVEVLKDIYQPSNRPGNPLRDDLREARQASGVKDSELFVYSTEHLRFEQEAKNKAWWIFRK